MWKCNLCDRPIQDGDAITMSHNGATHAYCLHEYKSMRRAVNIIVQLRNLRHKHPDEADLFSDLADAAWSVARTHYRALKGI